MQLSGGLYLEWATATSQSPYGAKWFATVEEGEKVLFWWGGVSQSPYGAKWFATRKGVPRGV